ncbi:hypothetical protein [Mesorhizobium sp. B2-8-3]|uniref:hypothetical protein n=1 Tax=Mesorhizobium sp. B2-8-3 TaxID=2589905 RepID=UPI00112B7277|nr:hypothetical protein [Mesorhizobium sp. B2-8-3]TPJ33698.1 hypothetical protein FJ418_13800 [Mesorhizobium sp. B2-8-3]
MSKQIIITKTGEEGAIFIDHLEGKVLTAADERPEWADGLANAMLAERSGWYEKRLGKQLSAELARPETIAFEDLEWIGIDAEGDEVHLEADQDYRMDKLAEMMGIDRQDFDGEKNFKNAIASAEVAHTYATQPTSEATLEEAEGQSFTEAAKAAANG